MTYSTRPRKIDNGITFRTRQKALNALASRKMVHTENRRILEFKKETSLSAKMSGKKIFTAKDKAKLVEIFGKPAEYLLARE